MKKVTNKAILLVIIVTLFSCQENKTIKWWSSREGKCFEEQRNLLWKLKSDSVKNLNCEIFLDSTEQEIDGFGGCFNELGWDALQKLEEPRREKVLNALFGKNDGLKFNLCRMPIGASDYSRNYYSLNDSVDDFSMEYFSIERDKKALIPYIKAAQKLQPDLKIWASPWTPPAWMKTNNHYACASSKQNKLPENRQGEEGENQIKMNDTVLLAYAKYFVKFVKLYKEQDIDISAIHVQNEFNSCQVFPSCTWTSCGLAEFIKTYLGPQFKKNHIKTNIWLGTIERSNIALVDTILGDKDALKYIKGLGFQWAGKDIIETAHTKYPEMRIMQTENECGDGSNDWKAAEHTFKLMKRYLNGGANSYMYWNMILDKNGLSHWGWKQNSLITIDTKAERAYYNPEYYLFKHFSGFISKGSVKVKVIGYKDIVAFITPDDNLVIVSANLGNKAYHLRLKVGKKYIEVKLPSKSFNTFVGNI